MSVDVLVPTLGESISYVMIAHWNYQVGDDVEPESILVELETDKINIEVPCPIAGKLVEIVKKPGDQANRDDVLARIEPATTGSAKKSKSPAASASSAPPAAVAAPADSRPPSPAGQRALQTSGLAAEQVQGSGKGGQILKQDVLAAAKSSPSATSAAVSKAIQAPAAHLAPEQNSSGSRSEEVVNMAPLRRTIAKRLVEAQQTAALLTTFNEVDMSNVMELRKRYQDEFLAKHQAKLGFMSFFVKAAVEALKAFPAINAEIRGDQIVYRNYYDIGVAVGGGKGLVVPILRNAERLSFADVEKAVKDFGTRAQDGKIQLQELQGGTFTISNGGVYGSLLSTPIVNPPQSGVLGLHKIQDRPIALNGQVVIRPMMYLALTYDHRLVDGREAVSFLVRIKDCIENPTRILLEL